MVLFYSGLFSSGFIWSYSITSGLFSSGFIWSYSITSSYLALDSYGLIL